MNSAVKVSIIIPTYNGAKRIGRCLNALQREMQGRPGEIVVVNDGSTDDTFAVVQRGYPHVCLVTQPNAGPAAARNHGARVATSEILLFTDDDCEPAVGWVDEMLRPFSDPAVVGAKGTYRTRQKKLVARFVQLDYEDRYRILARHADIDFIDTYAAAFRREKFLEVNGYDTSFPVACAEDVDLSFRMSARGWKMKFAPRAIVYHQHPETLRRYLRKKFTFACWRVLAVRKTPQKAIKDSHTPQLMKAQLLLLPALLTALAADAGGRATIALTPLVLLMFLVTTLPFAARSVRKDFGAGLISPLLLAARAASQVCGVVAGAFQARRRIVRAAEETAN